MNIFEDMTEATTKIFEQWGFVVPSGYGCGWQKIKCCWHNDTVPSASINLEEGAFVCYSCDRKGDLIKLVMEEEKLDYRGATGFIEKVVGRCSDALSQPASRFSRGRIPTEGPRSYEIGSGFFPAWFRRDTLDG